MHSEHSTEHLEHESQGIILQDTQVRPCPSPTTHIQGGGGGGWRGGGGLGVGVGLWGGSQEEGGMRLGWVGSEW
jgi:hypothetical protein